MDADDILNALNKLSERRIQEAIEAGEFDNLEGMGRPLQLDDNPHVPEDMRAAFKVLQNSGYAPDWMVVGGEIENELERLRADADRHFNYLRAAMRDLASDPTSIKRLGPEMSRLRARHRRAAQSHAARIEELNRKIGYFNHIVPIASLLKVPLSLEIEMRRFEDRVPAYLTYGQ
jgi:DnaJ homolog subfamily C member 28